MTIYEAKTTLTVSGGSANTVTLRVVGGLINYVLIRANTATTTFRASLADDDGVVRMNYGFQLGELVDDRINMPIQGSWTISILNASPNDTFKIILAARER